MMKVVVPVRNLVSDEDFTFNNIKFISIFNSYEYLTELKYHEDYELNRNTVLPYLMKFDLDWYRKCTLAIVDMPDIEIKEIIASHEKSLQFMKNCGEIVNRTLDLIRFHVYNAENPLAIPSYPTVCQDDFSSVLLLNDNNEFIPIVGRLYGVSVVEGVGLYLDDVTRYKNDPLYDILYNSEEYYLSSMLRKVMKRANEAMYISDPNTKLVYLMTTMEVINSSEFHQFKVVRKNIAAIISSNIHEYESMAPKMIQLSEEYRTDIVHNGIEVLKENDKLTIANINYVYGIIAQCVIKLAKSGAKSETDVQLYIEKRKVELGVKDEVKILKEQLIERFFNRYGTESIELEHESLKKILENLNYNFLKRIVENEDLLSIKTKVK